MIKEPRVGMRVRKCQAHCGDGVSVGAEGEITSDGCMDSFYVKYDDGATWRNCRKCVTEIKEDGMYLDEALKAVREDDSLEFSFEDTGAWRGWENLPNGGYSASYFGSNEFMVRCKTTKEVTMADLEAHYGCKVKVVK